MYSRLLASVALSLGLAGCVSNPNAMVFGTNTTFGVSAGSGATATPSIVVGYERQEAVLMPLVAAKNGDNGKVTSCDVAPGIDVLTSKEHPCVLVGRGVSSTGGDESDAFSVLASFGTDGSATVAGPNPEVSGKITQYFATGLAARRLAERSGAAAVATGPAAVTSAGAWTAAEVKKEVDGRTAGREAVAKRIDGNAGYKTLLQMMDVAAKTAKSKRFETLCASAANDAACANLVRQSRSLDGLSAEQLKSASEV